MAEPYKCPPGLVGTPRPLPSENPVRPGSYDRPVINVQTLTKSFSVAGNAFNRQFPLGQRIAQLELQGNAFLMGANLTTSIISITASATVAVFAALGENAVMSLDNGNNIFVISLTGQNSLAGVPAPSNRSPSFSPDIRCAVKIPSGVPISIYAASPSVATTLISGALTICYTYDTL